jgi:glycosyltransferase involved in cell wall biosynthesis
LKKVKVLIDLYYYKAAVSGIRSYISELKKSIDDHGSDQIQYFFSHDINKLSFNNTYLNSSNRFIRWVFQLKYLVYKQIVLPIKIFVYKPDYLICSDYIAPIISFNTKKITVIHDSLFWDYPENYKFLWRKYFISLVNLGIDSKAQIITTSMYSKNNLIRIFFNKTNKINYIYQTFTYFKTKEIDFQTPEKFILHVGSFEKRKDLLTLLKAFHLLKEDNLKLVLAGAQIFHGDDRVIKKIKRYIEKNKLYDKVILPGFISKERAAVFYKRASLYVFPSLDEGFGIPILEAFSFSIPVICSDIPVFREIGKNSVTYFKAGDPNSLVKKIKLVLYSNDLRKELVNNGKEHLKKFNRKNFIKGFEEIILNNQN